MRVQKSVSTPHYCGFPSDWLGALGVLAVSMDLHPGFSDESSLMEEAWPHPCEFILGSTLRGATLHEHDSPL